MSKIDRAQLNLRGKQVHDAAVDAARKRNRERDPVAAAVVDLIREKLGAGRVIYIGPKRPVG